MALQAFLPALRGGSLRLRESFVVSFVPGLEAPARSLVIQITLLAPFGVTEDFGHRDVRRTGLVAQAALDAVHQSQVEGLLRAPLAHSLEQGLCR